MFFLLNRNYINDFIIRIVNYEKLSKLTENLNFTKLS